MNTVTRLGLVALLCAGNVGAQSISIGVRQGQNTSWAARDPKAAIIGSTTGAFATFNLGPVLAFQAGLDITDKGWGTDGALTRLRYLEVPIVARFTYRSPGLRPFGLFGVARSLRLKYSETAGPPVAFDFGPDTTIDGPAECGCAESPRSKRDASLVFGLGVMRPIKRWDVTLEYRFTRSVRDMDDPSTSWMGLAPRNVVAAVMFGAAYRIR